MSSASEKSVVALNFIKAYMFFTLFVFAFFPVLIDSFHGLYVALLYSSKALFALLPIGYMVINVKRLKVKSALDFLFLIWLAYGIFSFLWAIANFVVNDDYLVRYIIGDFVGYISIPTTYFAGQIIVRSDYRTINELLSFFCVFMLYFMIAFFFREGMGYAGLFSEKASGFIFYPMVATLLVAGYSSRLRRVIKQNGWGTLLYLLILLALLAASGRRASLLAVLLGVLVIVLIPTKGFFKIHKFKIIVITFLPLMVFLLFLMDNVMVEKLLRMEVLFNQDINDVSLGVRVFEMMDVVRKFTVEGNLGNYFFGFGFGSLYEVWNLSEFEADALRHQVHISYMAVLLRNGAVALALYGSLVLLLLRNLYRNSHNDYALIGFITMVMFSLEIATAQYFYYSIVIPFAAILSNNSVQLQEQDKKQEVDFS